MTLRLNKMTLKEVAAKRGILIGSAVKARHIFWSCRYRKLLCSEFNALVCENEMKWGAIRKRKDFNFKEADYIVNFAQENNFKIRGHTLVWSKFLPDWLTKGDFTRTQIRNILINHIRTVVRRYKDKIYAWDVVNEPLRDDGKLDTNSFWYKNIGEEYLSLAFSTTHEEDPSALLFLNEWGADKINDKSNGLHELVKELIRSQVPIHGVGFQMHIGAPKNGYVPTVLTPQEIFENFERFQSLGLELHITEMDVQRGKSDLTDQEFFDQQSVIYRNVIDGALRVKNFKYLMFWELTDKHSWIPKFFHTKDYPLLFDRNYKPKKAYFAVREVLTNAK